MVLLSLRFFSSNVWGLRIRSCALPLHHEIMLGEDRLRMPSRVHSLCQIDRRWWAVLSKILMGNRKRKDVEAAFIPTSLFLFNQEVKKSSDGLCESCYRSTNGP